MFIFSPKYSMHIFQGKLEVPIECKRIDPSANMNWDEVKNDALKNPKLVQI